MTFIEKPQLSGDVAMGAAEVIEFQTATLPILIDRASRALLDAKSSAEVLEARDMARAAYDAAKSAGRIEKARRAHDEILAAVHRAQGEALLVEGRAKIRLAEEYEAAQERGEVASNGDNLPRIPDRNSKATAAEIGINPKDIHEGRKLRDAEKASPGKAERVIKEIVARGEEPTRAKVQREVVEKPTTKSEKSTLEVDPERRKLAKLTPEGLIDEVLGLRADLKDEKAKRAELARECKDLKERLTEALASDQGKTISTLQSQLRAAKYARDEAMAETKRFEYRFNKAEKRVAELEKMGIAV